MDSFNNVVDGAESAARTVIGDDRFNEQDLEKVHTGESLEGAVSSLYCILRLLISIHYFYSISFLERFHAGA